MQSTIIGVLVVMIAGLCMGSMAWPMKVTRRFQFEHTWLIAMFVGLVLVPWIITLSFCPHALSAYQAVPPPILIRSNLFAFGWGIANVLCGLCFVRIGIALTMAILTGLGVSLGVVMPMIFKGTGLFANAPGPTSTVGLIVLTGVGVILVGVVLASFAGFGRDKALKKLEVRTGSFLSGLIMTIIAGILSCGISFAFVYSQGPIMAAMKANGAGEMPASLAVWAVGLSGGALVNILYPIFLITKNKSWGVLAGNWGEVALAAWMGFQFFMAVALMGKGMLLLGTLGASVGFGIQQATQIIGGQGVGFISGEWRGVMGSPRNQMYLAIILMIIAVSIMSYGNMLTQP